MTIRRRRTTANHTRTIRRCPTPERFHSVRSPRRSSPAARARASSSGANASHGRSGPRSATRRTGAARCPASATRRRGSWSRGSRPPRTVATAPAACSPATGRATGSSARSTGRIREPTDVGIDGRRAPAARRVRGRRGAVRAAGQQADAGGARSLSAVLRARARAARSRPCRGRARRLRVRSARAGAGGVRFAAAGAAPEVRPRPRGADRGLRCSAATTRASRTRSPAGSPSPCSMTSFAGRGSWPTGYPDRESRAPGAQRRERKNQ